MGVTQELILNSYVSYIFKPQNTTIAQFLYDFSIIYVVTAATIFLLPLTVLVINQTRNFLAGMTTRSRLEAMKINFGSAITPITGREHAQQSMIQYHANLKIFKSTKTAE